MSCTFWRGVGFLGEMERFFCRPINYKYIIKDVLSLIFLPILSGEENGNLYDFVVLQSAFTGINPFSFSR